MQRHRHGDGRDHGDQTTFGHRAGMAADTLTLGRELETLSLFVYD